MILFNIRKNWTSFNNWYKHYIKKAKKINYAHEVAAPNAHLFHEYRKEEMEEAKIILNQLESLNLILTKVEHKVFNECLINKKRIKDMSPSYLTQTIDSIYKKWILICFPDEEVYVKKITPKKLGKVLKEIRLNIGYSVGAVCDQLKINESTLRNYELGNRLPRIDILYGLAEVYKTTIDEIIKKIIT